MNRRRVFAVASVVLLLALVSVGPTEGSYDQLPDELKNGEVSPSLGYPEINPSELPPPTNAKEYWIRGNVATRADSAQEYYREALSRSDSSVLRTHILKSWFRLGLLAPDIVDERLLERHLDPASETIRPDGELWFLAGQLAHVLDRNSLGDQFLANVSSRSPYHPDSLLLRANRALDRNQLDRADQFLSEYFLSDASVRRPRYWILKGRLYEALGADSEAYITYGHVINHYPASLNRTDAEERIADLPLPESLYSSGDRLDPGIETPGSNGETPGTSADNRDVTGDFALQVGSFQDRSRAVQMRNRLRTRLDYPVKIREVTVNDQLYHRVQILGLPSRDRARDLLTRLEKSGHQGFLVTP